jgi:hypothetical protein
MVLIGLLVAGCAAPLASPSTSPTPSSLAPTRSPAATVATIAFDDLPLRRANFLTMTIVCDPTPGIEIPTETQPLWCGDAMDIGVRVLETVTAEPILRAYVQRPVCGAAGCSLQDQNVADLILWTADGHWATHIDAVARTATLPVTAIAPRWPTLDAPIPAVDRPDLPMAPTELLEREAYPSCGHQGFDDASRGLCFPAAVLAGRPAERSATVYGTEGGEGIVVDRFSGSGSINVFSRHIDANAVVGAWYGYGAALVLGADPLLWTVEQLNDTFREYD